MKKLLKKEIKQLIEKLKLNCSIKEFDNKVDWLGISCNQKLSEEFIKEFENKVKINKKNNWLYWTKEQKLFYIKENNISYELVDDKYIIAYKSTREGGYSIYNYQYKYEVGKEFESHCNCNFDEENSFGLSAWTKEKALEYHSKGELYKVKIAIEDIGCFVHNNNKIRCHKIKVIEKI